MGEKTAFVPRWFLSPQSGRDQMMCDCPVQEPTVSTLGQMNPDLDTEEDDHSSEYETAESTLDLHGEASSVEDEGWITADEEFQEVQECDVSPGPGLQGRRGRQEEEESEDEEPPRRRRREDNDPDGGYGSKRTLDFGNVFTLSKISVKVEKLKDSLAEY
ncbi:hypothetical protein WMY93_029758 [Mugilogobius chulae]|uniref:Uncharacterized protein n=1 Tax=Mugilogobius chulae TaxID=88201 RepID=A0AAW0MPX7_9GOBI